ncbi:hypothetical protein SS50377_25827 [Spironucleus salmonicida]|uniref:Uncharacterized protein n=1 Tax=Spironucleus salmonicida TaxID=348837 RepID=V6LX66_9EUKA|nr:hypothetical protein SS50377_25827 [Spironucleus salmonicida]|eukprot:EST45414.1 Hypothetical protein SS50377_14646 [Spironucleus salmonicida]
MNNLFRSFSYLQNRYDRKFPVHYPQQLLVTQLMEEQNAADTEQVELEDKKIIQANYRRYGVIRRPHQEKLEIDEDIFFDLDGIDTNQAQPRDLDFINAQFVRNNRLQIERRRYRRGGVPE